MDVATIIRAWKDREFRLGLTEEERAQLPENPAGLLELDDKDLAQVVGGRKKGSNSRSKSGGRPGSKSRS
jgi:mersacidin/lichenicidin family type 2 lantibiotic